MRIVLSWLLLLLVLTGCADDRPSEASDCGLAIRFDGTVYSEAGFVKDATKAVGKADSASCDDMGEDARGAYFPDHPRQIEVWAFPGQETGIVLGTAEPDGSYRVFVAEGEDEAEVVQAVRQSLKHHQQYSADGFVGTASTG